MVDSRLPLVARVVPLRNAKGAPGIAGFVGSAAVACELAEAVAVFAAFVIGASACAVSCPCGSASLSGMVTEATVAALLSFGMLTLVTGKFFSTVTFAVASTCGGSAATSQSIRVDLLEGLATSQSDGCRVDSVDVWLNQPDGDFRSPLLGVRKFCNGDAMPHWARARARARARDVHEPHKLYSSTYYEASS